MVGSIAIDVTPAILLIKQYTSAIIELNLVRICGVADLVEHFLLNVEHGSDVFTPINYTGIDRSLFLGDDIPSNVFLFIIDPKAESTIIAIIVSTAMGKGLPVKLLKEIMTRMPAVTFQSFTRKLPPDQPIGYSETHPALPQQ